jgi:hypothetical protein
MNTTFTFGEVALITAALIGSVSLFVAVAVGVWFYLTEGAA